VFALIAGKNISLSASSPRLLSSFELFAILHPVLKIMDKISS
jgi:hypothetical protein